jgi:hypothetical protein
MCRSEARGLGSDLAIVFVWSNWDNWSVPILRLAPSDLCTSSYLGSREMRGLAALVCTQDWPVARK